MVYACVEKRILIFGQKGDGGAGERTEVVG